MQPQNLKNGDRVRHTSRDEVGTVKINEEGHVMVTFDNPTPRGHKSVGIYDHNWFEIYPNGLTLESGLPPIDAALHTPDMVDSLQQRALAPSNGDRASG